MSAHPWQLGSAQGFSGNSSGVTVLIALCAYERVLGPSRLAMAQFNAVAALFAADTETAVVRVSLYGAFAIVDADGTVLAVSEPYTDGVLTLAGDVIHHRPGMP
ncbi:MAG: hypothetical protein H7338_12370 [Candidatus Sericytochromatia bacterium]|nr:hypothetical protein [Candidatus Sericytochromatia bacterium]